MPDTGAPWNIPYAAPADLVRGWPALSEDVALAIVAALESIPVTIKKVAAFTGSGTWTVPAGVTYAIAHMMGGGGGASAAAGGSNGSASSVAFASGTVSAAGGQKSINPRGALTFSQAGAANSGQNGVSATEGGTDASISTSSTSQAFIVAGAAVTPAAEITVTVGAGGTGTAAGGSGYVYIEYYE